MSLLYVQFCACGYQKVLIQFDICVLNEAKFSCEKLYIYIYIYPFIFKEDLNTLDISNICSKELKMCITCTF